MSDEIDYTNVKKFRMEVRRLSLKDHPMAPGSTALAFTEDPEGKPFSVLAEEILQANSISEIQFKNDLFTLKYWINLEITSEASEQDVQDLRYGLAVLDEPAYDYRVKLQTNEVEKEKERYRHIPVNVHVIGLYNVDKYLQEFDTCCLDMSKLDMDSISKGLVFIASAAQRINPTVYVIPTEAANKLDDKDFKDTAFAQTMSTKVKLKSVFAPVEGLENPFVRAI